MYNILLHLFASVMYATLWVISGLDQCIKECAIYNTSRLVGSTRPWHQYDRLENILSLNHVPPPNKTWKGEKTMNRIVCNQTDRERAGWSTNLPFDIGCRNSVVSDSVEKGSKLSNYHREHFRFILLLAEGAVEDWDGGWSEDRDDSSKEWERGV